MSRVGKMPVVIPSGVTVSVADGRVHVKGPKGGTVSTHVLVGTAVAVEGGEVARDAPSRSRAIPRSAPCARNISEHGASA